MRPWHPGIRGLGDAEVRPCHLFLNGNRSGKVDEKLETYEEIPPTSFL